MADVSQCPSLVQRRIAQNSNDPLAWEMLGYLLTLRGDNAAATEALGKCVVSSRCGLKAYLASPVLDCQCGQPSTGVQAPYYHGAAGLAALAICHPFTNGHSACVLAFIILTSSHWPINAQPWTGLRPCTCLRGHDTTALCLLGESLSRQEQHAEAERVFKAAAIPGGPVRALVGLAKSQSGQGAMFSHLSWLLSPESTVRSA